MAAKRAEKEKRVVNKDGEIDAVKKLLVGVLIFFVLIILALVIFLILQGVSEKYRERVGYGEGQKKISSF